jgi:hypothetical protein
MGEMLHLRPSGGGGGGGGVQCLVRALVRLPQLEDDGRPSDALCAACSGATALQTAVSGHITPPDHRPACRAGLGRAVATAGNRAAAAGRPCRRRRRRRRRCCALRAHHLVRGWLSRCKQHHTGRYFACWALCELLAVARLRDEEEGLEWRERAAAHQQLSIGESGDDREVLMMVAVEEEGGRTVRRQGAFRDDSSSAPALLRADGVASASAYASTRAVEDTLRRVGDASHTRLLPAACVRARVHRLRAG